VSTFDEPVPMRITEYLMLQMLLSGKSCEAKFSWSFGECYAETVALRAKNFSSKDFFGNA